MNCPYYKQHGKLYISCKRGEVSDKFEGDLVIHIGKYCNNHYTECKCYKRLERAWGSVKPILLTVGGV